MNEQLNIIITGKSGVGKSSFLNYLVDREVFKTGIGEPVTPDYFDNIDFVDPKHGIKYCLYDTKGIEPDTTTECVNKIIEQIQTRDQSDDVFDWIHTVYYCFSASSKRIEPFEVDFIKELLLKGVSVVILLTKRDLVSDSDLKNLKDQFVKDIGDKIQLVPVCSVAVRTRKGSSERSGKEDVLKASFLGLWDKLALRLPMDVVAYFEDLSNYYCNNQNINEIKVDAWLSYLEDPSIESFWNFVRNYKGDQKTLSGLRDFPSLRNVFSSDLEKNDRSKIIDIVHNGKHALDILKYKIEQFSNFYDEYHYRQKHEEMIDKVFSFYKKITNSKMKVLYKHKAIENLSEIKNFVIDIKEIESSQKYLEECFDEVSKCFLFDSDEKRDAKDAYDTFHDLVRDTASRFTNVLNNYVSAFQAELHQYGQYCIRRDELFEEYESIPPEVIYNSVYKALHDYRGGINLLHEQLLEELRQALDLTEEQTKNIKC